MSRKPVLLSTLAVAGLAALAFAGTYQHRSGGIAFEVPSGWFVQTSGDQLTMESPDEAVVISVWVARRGDWDSIIEALDDELELVIDRPRYDEGAETELNGMRVYDVSGSGFVDGESVEWTGMVLIARKPVLVVAAGTSEGWSQNRGDVVRILKSVRRTP